MAQEEEQSKQDNADGDENARTAQRPLPLEEAENRTEDGGSQHQLSQSELGAR